MKGYYDNRAEVEVIFNTGEIETYQINASPGIGQWLAREAGQTGVLCLMNAGVSVSIPLASIRNWKVSPIPLPAETQQESEEANANEA